MLSFAEDVIWLTQFYTESYFIPGMQRSSAAVELTSNLDDVLWIQSKGLRMAAWTTLNPTLPQTPSITLK